MEHQLLNHSDLLNAMFTNNLYEKAVQQANRKYKIKHYRIDKLKPSGIKNLLKKNPKKEKSSKIEQNNYAWAEGQLKVFIWCLVGYVYIKKIDINDLKDSDFHFFTEIFEDYSVDFLNYQAKFLLRSPEKVVWKQNQAKLLNQIIKAKFQQKNWNTVAYELYLHSEKTVFRTPKQCRERWLNHEDPNKIHSQWTVQEDIQLLRFVKILGRKWSHISKSMKSTRTQHMVKNRFTSLLKKATKNLKSFSQKELIDQLLKTKKLQKIEKDNQITSPSSVNDESNSQAQNNSEMDPESNVQLQQIEIENEDLNKKEKQLEYFFPCNLIMEQASDIEPELIFVENNGPLDFFEKDQLKSNDMFLGWFD